MAAPNVSPADILELPQPKVRHVRDDMVYARRTRQEPQGEAYDERNDELFRRLKSWFLESVDLSAGWRREAKEMVEFCAGWQWSSEDIAILSEQNRPVVTFNRSGRNVDLISGMEIQGRNEVAFLPREEGDVGKSDVLTGALEYVSDETDASDEKTDAFRDLVVTGLGWTQTVMDYVDYEQGMPVESRIDPLEMYWDWFAKKRNLKNRRWNARALTMPMEEGERLFPKVNKGLLHAGWANIDDDMSSRSGDSFRRYNDYDETALGANGTTQQLDRITIIEIEWWEMEDNVLLEDTFTLERAEMPKKRADALIKSFPGRYVGQPKPGKCYYRAFLGGRLLAKVKLEKVKGFTFQPMTGKRCPRNGWMGMVRAMADPQRWANKWLSQSMHMLNTGAKGGAFYEPGAFVDGRKAERDWGKHALIAVGRGAISGGKILERQPAQFPQELHNLLPFALTSIQDCVGVTNEQLGTTAAQNDANRAARLEEGRREAGVTLMAHFFDSKRLHSKRQGRLMLRYIVTFMNDGRLIRITNEDNEQYVRLVINDPQSVDYDIVVDEAPDSTRQKDKTWAVIQGLLPTLEAVGAPPSMYKRFVEFMPLPAKLIRGIQEDIDKAEQESAQEPPPDPQLIKAMNEQQKLPAEIEKIQAEIAKLMADTQRLVAAAGLAQAQTRESTARVELDALEGIRETIAVDDAREKNKLTTHENA